MRKKLIFGSLAVIILVVGCYIAFLQFKIYQASHEDIPQNADYVLILGARVKGTVPSLSLKYRMDAAAEYLRANEDAKAIVSGGQGSGEDISEAEAMRRGLVERGIEESRIILEDQSTSTYENITFSKKLIPKGNYTILLVSNDFHLYRAGLMADQEGLNTIGLPAKTPKVVVVKSHIREYLAITKFYIVKK